MSHPGNGGSFTRHMGVQTSDYKVGLEECLEGAKITGGA